MYNRDRGRDIDLASIQREKEKQKRRHLDRKINRKDRQRERHTAMANNFCSLLFNQAFSHDFI